MALRIKILDGPSNLALEKSKKRNGTEDQPPVIFKLEGGLFGCPHLPLAVLIFSLTRTKKTGRWNFSGTASATAQNFEKFLGYIKPGAEVSGIYSSENKDGSIRIV